MQTDTFPHANISRKDALSVAQKTNREILQQLFGHTLKIALVHAIASLLVLFWLASVANLTELTIWFCIVTSMSCFRLFLYAAYTKHCDNKNRHLWLHTWAGCSATMSSLYAIALIYFTPFEQAEYAMGVGLFIVGLSAVFVMIYSASVYAVLSFLVPIMLMPSYFLIAAGGDSGIMTVLIMGFYTLAVLVLVTNISNAFKRSILVGFQHQHELEKRQQVEQQLQDISRRDGLTGIFNRRYFDEMLEAEIGRAHRNHQPLCLLMFDVDCFKEYNQKYGHIAGDNCLVSIADMAQALASRQGDLTARYCGEKFGVILPNIDLKGAISFANKLQHEIQKRRIPHATSKLTTLKCVTISIGVTNLMPFTKAKPNELVKYADAALYEAKRQGRNRVHFNENNGLNQSASL
ncbi:MAG: diguanylate cyclase (GGDEF)-like protein [Alphaproteobacteria bacterium]|jgi:diguanylate cyclase (GGDEF)-like protein